MPLGAVMRRPFMENGRRSRKGLCRYQRIKIMNEQRHGWLVMKYQFSSGAEYRIPIYRIRRERTYRNYFRMKLAGRATETVFQFHRPFRGNASFKMSAYRPKNLLAKTDVEGAWAEEAESRIDAYDRGDIKSVSVQKVMARYEKK